jgi:hypothetical protein
VIGLFFPACNVKILLVFFHRSLLLLAQAPEHGHAPTTLQTMTDRHANQPGSRQGRSGAPGLPRDRTKRSA